MPAADPCFAGLVAISRATEKESRRRKSNQTKAKT